MHLKYLQSRFKRQPPHSFSKSVLPLTLCVGTTIMNRSKSRRTRLNYKALLLPCSSAFYLLIYFVNPNAHALDESNIKNIESAVVKHICSDTAWLKCWSEPPEKCDQIIGKVTATCIGQYLQVIPQGIQFEEANDLGVKVIECLNHEFASTHPTGKKDSPECQIIPLHLQ